MRIAFILLLQSFSCSLMGQNNFAKELDQIIKDTANHFQKSKGPVKERPEKQSDYTHFCTHELDCQCQ